MDTVKRAAALLDRAKPGWENLIDTETLDLIGVNSSRDCVLGQVYGDFWTGADEFFRTCPPDFEVTAETDPFNEYSGQDNEHTLRWLEEIQDRRALHNNPAQLQIDFKKVAA